MTEQTNNYVSDVTAQTTNQLRLMSRKQAAEYLGLKPQTLAMWKSTGQFDLPVVKVGRLAKYLKSDLDKFIAHRRKNF